MSRDAADDPELLVPPPLLDADSAPPQLEDAGGEDGDEECDEEEAQRQLAGRVQLARRGREVKG